MNGATFNFEQVDGVVGKRLERGKQGAGTVSEAKRNGHLTGGGRGKFFGTLRGKQEDEACEIFRIVVDVFGKDDTAIDVGGAASCNAREGFVASGEGVANATGGVFRGNAFQLWVSAKEILALGERDRMRGDGTNVREGGARTANELMFDVEDGFGNHREIAFEQKIEHANDRACESVFDGSQERIGSAVANCGERGVKRGPGHGSDGVAKKLNGGSFAESSMFALKGNTRFFESQGHSGLRCGFVAALSLL